MVMAQALFITLKQHYPDCQIDVVSPQWSLPILERMPEVRNGVALRVAHGEFDLKTRYRLGRSLRSRNYTHAIVLPRSWKSALLPYFAAVPVRTGFKGEMRYVLLNDMRKLNTSVLTKTVQRYVALAYDEIAYALSPPETPYPELRVDKRNTDRLVEDLGLKMSKPVIGFMPGAEYGPAKQWPAGYFAKLADYLSERGYQVWLFGSAKEVALGDEIAKLSNGEIYNLCGKTELTDVIDLLVCAEQVVSNDSGLMHVAAALDVPLIAVFGSTNPVTTGPCGSKSHVVRAPVACSPCLKTECPTDHRCMKEVTVDMVYDVAEQLL